MILLYWIEERVLGTLLINDKVPTIIVFLISVHTLYVNNTGGMYGGVDGLWSSKSN